MNTQQPLLSFFFSATLSFYLLFLFHPISAVAMNDPDNYIRTSCHATSYPDVCYTTLSPFANTTKNDAAELARTAISVSLSKAQCTAKHVTELSHEANNNNCTASALHSCSTNFKDAVDKIQKSLNQMRALARDESLRFQISNVMTWLDEASKNEETCKEGFQGVPDGNVKSDVNKSVADAKELTSNAIQLVNNYIADKIGGSMSGEGEGRS